MPWLASCQGAPCFSICIVTRGKGGRGGYAVKAFWETLSLLVRDVVLSYFPSISIRNRQVDAIPLECNHDTCQIPMLIHLPVRTATTEPTLPSHGNTVTFPTVV